MELPTWDEILQMAESFGNEDLDACCCKTFNFMAAFAVSLALAAEESFGASLDSSASSSTEVLFSPRPPEDLREMWKGIQS